MKKYWKKALLALTVVAVAIVAAMHAGDVLTFEKLKQNSAALTAYVERHYFSSLILFALGHIAAAFFIPGTLLLTLAGGYLFGGLPGALYASLFSTAGSTLAFLFARHLVGRSLQRKYEQQLSRFNEEMHRHGPNYLFMLRVIPVMPSFLLNYLSGLTSLSAPRFASVTFLGLFPGALVYSIAGSQLATLETPRDVLSPKVLLGFLLMAVLALLPVMHSFSRRWTGK